MLDIPKALSRPRCKPARGRRSVAAILLLVLLAPGVVSAHHTTITTSSQTYSPTPWNGYKVYLSSPRHGNSGSRGECGWEENINGRHWNINAAYRQTYNTNTQWRFWERRYRTQVSPNNRDDGFLANRNASDNWGADVHIVTHTNAAVGCNNSASPYLLVMYKSGNTNSVNLTNDLLSAMNPFLPGGQNSWPCTFSECNALATHRTYVELFFHTNQSAVNWYQAGGSHGNGVRNAWLYGLAVDEHLGSPR